jgi:hypothetical protein
VWARWRIFSRPVSGLVKLFPGGIPSRKQRLVRISAETSSSPAGQGSVRAYLRLDQVLAIVFSTPFMVAALSGSKDHVKSVLFNPADGKAGRPGWPRTA